ncbi:undecaprenyl-phosphate galactose phosphotransferase WbaP [Oceanithermus sp.]
MSFEFDAKTSIRLISANTRPWLTGGIILVSDIVSLLIAGLLAVTVKSFVGQGYQPNSYVVLWPAVALFIIVFFVVGLYPGVGLAPVEEFRRLTLATTLVYLILGAGTFMFKEGNNYSRAVFLGAWVFSVVLVPLNRALVRHILAHRPWWGYPVVVLGAGKTGRMVVKALQRNPGLGFKPLAILDDNSEKQGSVEGIPVIGGMELAPTLAKELHVRHAIVAMPGVPREKLLLLLEGYGNFFAHIILIPDLFGFSTLWVSTSDLGGVLGLELRQSLLLKGPQIFKRAVDVSLSLLGGILTLPFFLLIALWIKIDSHGPVFYLQERLGKNGRRFMAIKFRTMYQNAEARLQQLLDQDPALREEYDLFHKLKDDPRVTRAGQFLRKFSLDELPQLWNVIRGEMSLVGPRAYLPRELPAMDGSERIILRVLPGITGLWQVSGRNQISFKERLEIDIYYVRNWSIWLDLYILARTVWVVISRHGAY